jgi:hypothetical protein
MTVYEFTDFIHIEWEGNTAHHRIHLCPSLSEGYFSLAVFPHHGGSGEGYDFPIPRRDIRWRLEECGVYVPVLGYAKWTEIPNTRDRCYPRNPFMPREESKPPPPKVRRIVGPVVYFIRSASSGFIKIGKANDPIARLKTMQTGSSDRLALIGYVAGSNDKERELHRRFAALRKSGEWFEPGKELLDFINSVAVKEAVAA